MIGAGVSSVAIVLACAVAFVAALAWPVMAFIAMRALTRIANQVEEINRKLSKN
jgi:hypothetical protein